MKEHKMNGCMIHYMDKSLWTPDHYTHHPNCIQCLMLLHYSFSSLELMAPNLFQRDKFPHAQSEVHEDMICRGWSGTCTEP